MQSNVVPTDSQVANNSMNVDAIKVDYLSGYDNVGNLLLFVWTFRLEFDNVHECDNLVG